MREYKYRVWDDNIEEMVYFNLHERDWHRTDGRYPLMEYIGRQDKNGKDIYEGDIDIDKGVVVWCDRLNWDSGGSIHPGFYFKDCWKYTAEGELDYHEGFDDCEIIGNIYENPELNKEK